MKKAKELKLALTEKDLPKLRKRWTHASNTVDEASAINVVQMLTVNERIHFVNELWRVMKSGAKAQLVTPHWSSARAYGDLAFQWPPVSESWFYHLNAKWRSDNAAWGTKYQCDFDPTWGYGLHPLIVNRNQEYQQHAVSFFKEAAQDLIVTLIRR